MSCTVSAEERPSLEHTAASGAEFSASRSWETGALIDRWIFRPPGRAIARALLPTRVRPNHVSTLSALLGLLGGIAYARATPRSTAVGGLLVFLTVVLDCVDGELARARGKPTEIGKLFDNLADPSKTIFLFFGVAIGMHRTGSWSLALFSDVPFVVRVYGLGVLAGASMVLQVVGRNTFAAYYNLHAKGRTETSMARMDLVRSELDDLRRQGGHLLERIVVPIVLALSGTEPPRAPPERKIVPEYGPRTLPYVRAWTFFGGGTQFFVLVVASIAGEPLYAFVYITLLSNLVCLPLLLLSRRAHRAALA